MSDPSPWRVPLADVEVGEALVASVEQVIRSGWWSMGPRVAELEQAFASLCHVPHAIATSNGTASLHLALLATGCQPGDEVVMPSLNFVAAANATRLVGATPVFCDISGEDDLNLDPDDVEAAITNRTRAVIALHYGGAPCDLTRLSAIADGHDVALIEDAAHAPGASLAGRPCGSIGVMGCFSFFSNKNLPIGEGGMLVTAYDEAAARARLLRSHGMTTLTWERHRGHAHSYDVVEPGFNYRLDDVRAAMALAQLERLHERNAHRAELMARYVGRLHGERGLRIPFATQHEGRVSAHHLAVAVLPRGVDRDGVREELRRERIQTSVHYPPIHRFSAFAELGRGRALPHTDAIADRLITLPLYPALAPEDVDAVCRTLLTAVARATASR